jgi:hypothetical protein
VPDDPAPFSEFLGLPVLTEGHSRTQLMHHDFHLIFQSFFGLKPLSQKKPRAKLKAFKPFLGLKLLSDNPAPLSSMFRLPLLKEPKFRKPLMDNPAPLSSAFKVPTLQDKDNG